MIKVLKSTIKVSQDFKGMYINLSANELEMSVDMMDELNIIEGEVVEVHTPGHEPFNAYVSIGEDTTIKLGATVNNYNLTITAYKYMAQNSALYNNKPIRIKAD
jgi:hypothetical protein